MVLSKDTQVARVELGHALVPLFRPLQRKPRAKVEQHIGPATLHWRAFWALDAADQSVLLALVWLLGRDARQIGAQAPGADAQALWAELDPKNGATSQLGAAGRLSMRELILTAGWEPSGFRRRLVRQSLERLAHVIITGTNGATRWSCSLIGWRLDEDSGQLQVALNPALAVILLTGGQHVRYQLAERHELKSDSAKIVHVWLSAWLRPGGEGTIGLDRLSEHVWPEPTSAAGQRRRRSDLLAALEELRRVGWEVEASGKKFVIRRPPEDKASEKPRPRRRSAA